MTSRIRWEPNEDGRDYTPAYRGYAGTSTTVVHFVIYPPAEVLGRVREWVLRSDLPGQDHHFAEAPRREDLEPHAERWLEEHVSSLGAVFESSPGGSVTIDLGDQDARAVLANALDEYAEWCRVQADDDEDHEWRTRWAAIADRMCEQVTGSMRELESGEERSDEDAPPANGNCPALFCSHLWTLHGPDGCTGKVFPAHSLTGEPCPCKRTEDGEPR